MADNININGIQIPQLPTEDSPAGFEAIGYKSGRTSKVPLDTLATKVELQDTVVGTNLLGSKANVATIKSEVITPKKGDTYKATDTGHYWKYNDVISGTNPYDPNKWVDIGIVIPSDVMLNGGSTKTGKQLDEEKLDSGGYFGNAQNLYDLIFSIEGGYNGIASTDIINPLTQGYYVSLTGGTFPNFGNISIPEGYSIIYYDNSVWKYESIPLNPNNPILDTEFFI